MKKIIALIVATCGLAIHTGAAHAAPDAGPDCAIYSNATLMSWPATSPVWQFCWRRPADSTPQPSGSGIELLDVYYNGHMVFSHLNVPVLNVEYGPGGCGCYRDWLDEEVRFEAVGAPCGNGYCEVIEPARTECDCAPTDTCDSNPDNECNVDLGSFTGVAADKEPDHLTMTTEMSAGWYRYSQYLTFNLDGSIQPEFAFSSLPNGCTDTAHFHHGYYRFDFDIDGPANDEVFRETLPAGGHDSDNDGHNDNVDNCLLVANADQRDTDGDGYGNACDADLNNDGSVNFSDLGTLKERFFTTDPDADFDGDGNVNFTDLGIMKAAFFQAPGPSGTVPQDILVTTEEYGYHGDTVSWLATDTASGRGYRVTPGVDDEPLPITTFDPAPFAVGDYWVLAEHDDENDDLGGSCSININPFANGEATGGADIVLWYRYGALHENGDECFCGRRGPTLVPVGNWLPSP